MKESGFVQKASGGVTAAKGFSAGGIHCGVKKAKLDLAMIYTSSPAAAAGVFTQNLVKASPVLVTKENIASGYGRAVVINSGNANACTGQKGIDDAEEMASQTAGALGVKPAEVLVASTGVIGVPLPMENISEGINKLGKNLSPTGSYDAAEAIMTTDTFPKQAAVEVDLGGTTVKIGGIAKGSGMIHPNMATLLGFITSDAAISPQLLQKALKDAVNRSFNMISIDGDTSTNDMIIVLANGEAENPLIENETKEFYRFQEGLFKVCTMLAKLIVRDGEGATKLIEIEVRGAAAEEDARKIARSIANSNLVKTAMYGEDANWGRILVAAGYSGGYFDPAKVDVYLESSAGSEKMANAGMGLAFSEENAARILRETDIKIVIDLNLGQLTARAWACDLSYEYIKINTEYRT